MSLFDLGQAIQQERWASPFFARRTAITRCMERATNPNRLACLQHALQRVELRENIVIALSRKDDGSAATD